MRKVRDVTVVEKLTLCIHSVLHLRIFRVLLTLCYVHCELAPRHAVERVSLGQEEDAPTPAPFEWDPNDE